MSLGDRMQIERGRCEELQRTQGTFWADRYTRIILFVVMLSKVCTHVKTWQIVCFREIIYWISIQSLKKTENTGVRLPGFKSCLQHSWVMLITYSSYSFLFPYLWKERNINLSYRIIVGIKSIDHVKRLKQCLIHDMYSVMLVTIMFIACLGQCLAIYSHHLIWSPPIIWWHTHAQNTELETNVSHHIANDKA